MRKPPPPQVYFIGSAVFHYLGPAFAVLLFARVQVLGVALVVTAGAGATRSGHRARPSRDAPTLIE